MTLRGLDANCGLDYERVAAAGFVTVGRYLRDDEYEDEFGHTRAEAELAASFGIRSFHYGQNGDTRELWEGRPGFDGGYDAGRELAHIFRVKQRPITGAQQAIVFCADKRTSPEGRWPITTLIAALAGACSVIGRARVGLYGTRYSIDQALRAGVVGGPIVQTRLHDGIYDTPPKRPSPWHPAADALQYRNQDREGTPPGKADHFGAEGRSYVALLRLRHQIGWLPQ